MPSFLQSRSDEYEKDTSPLAPRDANLLDSSCERKQRLHLSPVKAFYFKLGLEKMLPTYNKVYNRRKCYSFQVLKQFFLFSSSEESLSANYKYMRHELEGVADKLENTIGMECKITIGKAFLDIREFCRKRKVYRDQSNIVKLVEKAELVFTKQAYREGLTRMN